MPRKRSTLPVGRSDPLPGMGRWSRRRVLGTGGRSPEAGARKREPGAGMRSREAEAGRREAGPYP